MIGLVVQKPAKRRNLPAEVRGANRHQISVVLDRADAEKLADLTTQLRARTWSDMIRHLIRQAHELAGLGKVER